MPESKLSQPWNVVGGQVLSSIVGVAVRLALTHHVPWLANALGMSLALVAMQLTTTVHPPGAAAGGPGGRRGSVIGAAVAGRRVPRCHAPDAMSVR